MLIETPQRQQKKHEIWQKNPKFIPWSYWSGRWEMGYHLGWKSSHSRKKWRMGVSGVVVMDKEVYWIKIWRTESIYWKLHCVCTLLWTFVELPATHRNCKSGPFDFNLWRAHNLWRPHKRRWYFIFIFFKRSWLLSIDINLRRNISVLVFDIFSTWSQVQFVPHGNELYPIFILVPLSIRTLNKEFLRGKWTPHHL